MYVTAAHPGFTWLTKNARRLGPRSLRSRDPRRRTFLVSQVKPDLAALSCALLNLFDNLTGGSPWLHLGDRQRPPPRALLWVAHCPSDVRPRRPGLCSPASQCSPGSPGLRRQRHAISERSQTGAYAVAAAAAWRACAVQSKQTKNQKTQKKTFQTFRAFWSTIRFREKPT